MPKMTNPAAYCEAALNAVCFGPPSDAEAAISTYFTDDYEQTTDGEVSDRAAFATHIAYLRGLVTAGRIEVTEAVADGGHVATRHTVHLTLNGGRAVILEVHLFGEFAPDGRLRRVHELTRLVDGADPAADRELARAR